MENVVSKAVAGDVQERHICWIKSKHTLQLQYFK